MLKKRIVVAMVLSLGGAAFGPCSKEEKVETKPAAAVAPPPTVEIATATVSASASAAPKPTATAKAATPAKTKRTKAGSKPLGHGNRGGSGSSRPQSSSSKTSSTSAGLGDPVDPPPDPDPCDGLPDREAECDGKKLYYCQDHNLSVVNCDTVAKQAAYTSGDCVEAPSDHITDCLGCDVDSDGSVLCCDFGGTICCDEKGDCFDPKD